jgi:hypothetical protein
VENIAGDMLTHPIDGLVKSSPGAGLHITNGI